MSAAPATAEFIHRDILVIDVDIQFTDVRLPQGCPGLQVHVKGKVHHLVGALISPIEKGVFLKDGEEFFKYHRSPHLSNRITAMGMRKKTVMIYKKGIHLLLMAKSETLLANHRGSLLKGHHITIPVILNNRCTNATTTALGFSVAREASMAVKVVPTFAPRVYGKICSRLKIPAPAMGTIKLVVMELLWARMVSRSPTTKPLTAVLNRTLSNHTSALFTTRTRRILTIRFKDKKSTIKDKTKRTQG
jgi:hypothetical protein